MPTLEENLLESINQHVASRELWQQQSMLHETARQQLLGATNQQILAMQKGVNGRGAAVECRGIFGGYLHYQAGAVAGSDDFALVNRDTGVNGEGYLHLKIPVIKNNNADVMCLYTIRGYNYGSNTINDEKSAAYLYYTGVYHQTSKNNGMRPFFYVGSDNYFYLRLYLVSQYFNQIVFDVMDPQSRISNIESRLKFIGGRITSVNVENV